MKNRPLIQYPLIQDSLAKLVKDVSRAEQKRIANEKLEADTLDSSPIPDLIIVGQSLRLRPISYLHKIFPTLSNKSVWSFFDACSIPLLYLGKTAYYNETVLEHILFLVTSPGERGLVVPGSVFRSKTKFATGPWSTNERITPYDKVPSSITSRALSVKTTLSLTLASSISPTAATKLIDSYLRFEDAHRSDLQSFSPLNPLSTPVEAPPAQGALSEREALSERIDSTFSPPSYLSQRRAV